MENPTMGISASVEQSRKLAGLFERRATTLQTLSDIDEEIDALQRGEQPASTGSGKKRGRKPATAETETETKSETETVEATKPKGAKRFRNKVSMKELLVQIASRFPKRGIDLDGFTKECHAAGYKSTSDPDGYVQNIRTNLNGLMNDGVIVKTEDRRYFLKEHYDALESPAEAA